MANRIPNVNDLIPNNLTNDESEKIDKIQQSIEILQLIKAQYIIELSNIRAQLYNDKRIIVKLDDLIHRISESIGKVTRKNVINNIETTRRILKSGKQFNLNLSTGGTRKKRRSK